MRSNIWRLLAPATGPLAVLLTLVGIFVGHPGIAQAAPALSFDGSCTPDTVRPAAAALITCTFSVTNTGDAPALNLAAQPSAPSAPCAIASPIYIDRTINGVSVAASGTRYNLGNLLPNAKVTSTTRLAIINQGSGMKGTKVTVFSQAEPSIQASGDVCWNVDPSASEPSFRMEVTKTPINAGGCVTPPISSPATLQSKEHRALEQRQAEPAGRPLAMPEPQGFFGGCPPPPRPDYGGPVPISPPDQTPGLVEFEIVVTNMSGPAVLDISVLDVETGSGVFVESDPPPTGSDFLGRPIWNVGTLDQGEEYRITASYGPQQPDRCLMAYDVAIVTSTPTGGSDENYAAFPGSGQQVGNCEGGGNSTLCWHYPPDDTGFAFPDVDQCDQEVCWVLFDFGGGEVFWEPHFGDCAEEVCNFVSPIPAPPQKGTGTTDSCEPPVCWIPHGEIDTFHYDPRSCNAETCLHTAPDSSTGFYEGCDTSVCWTMPPGSSVWDARFFDECELDNPCWFMPPGKGEPAINDCDLDLSEVCWSTDFFFGEGIAESGPVPVPGGGPMIQSGADPYSTLPCDFLFCEFTAPDGVTTANGDCDFPVCWSIPPEGSDWQSVFSCEGDFCWYTAEGGGGSVLDQCDFEFCLITAPDGSLSTLFGFDGQLSFSSQPPFAVSCGFVEEICWSTPPPDEGPYVAVLSYCDEDVSICWGAPPNDTADWPVECGTTFCWTSWPNDFPDPTDVGLSPDQLVDGPCPPDDPGETGQTGSFEPAEPEPALSSPADLVESQSVEEIEPEPSMSKTPATFSDGTGESVDAEPSSSSEPVEMYRPDLVDYDGDGCSNLRERGFSPLTGGLRDPENVWDFFDTPGAGNARDGSITAADIARVVQRFGRSGSAAIDPLSMPPVPPNYHTAFDRMPDGAAANGSITTQDIAVEVGQFGNTCL